MRFNMSDRDTNMPRKVHGHYGVSLIRLSICIERMFAPPKRVNYMPKFPDTGDES